VIGKLAVLGDAAQRWGLDVPAALAHAEHAAALGRTLSPLWPAVFARQDVETPDVDQDLYGGFVGNEDRRSLQRLRALNPTQLASKRVAFQDPRLDELLFRYRARNHPETLNGEEQARWARHRAECLHQGLGGGQTLAAYFERIDELAEAAIEAGDERGQALLEALVDYGQGIAPESR